MAIKFQKILKTQNLLPQAKTNYFNPLFDYNASKARLDKSIGVDVQLS